MYDLRFTIYDLNVFTRNTFFIIAKFFYGAFGNEGATASSSFGTEVDDPIAGTNDIGIMLNDENRVAFVHQSA